MEIRLAVYELLQPLEKRDIASFSCKYAKNGCYVCLKAYQFQELCRYTGFMILLTPYLK